MTHHEASKGPAKVCSAAGRASNSREASAGAELCRSNQPEIVRRLWQKIKRIQSIQVSLSLYVYICIYIYMSTSTSPKMDTVDEHPSLLWPILFLALFLACRSVRSVCSSSTKRLKVRWKEPQRKASALRRSYRRAAL